MAIEARQAGTGAGGRARRWRVLAVAAALAGVSAPAALADYVGSLVNRIFIDPASVQEIADGYQVGDEIAFILETTPADTGSDFGHAAWMTVYIPAGVEVVGAEYVLPAGNGGYDRVPAEDTDETEDGCGPRGCQFADGPPLDDGYINRVQQDTGIFYSTDVSTRVIPYVATPACGTPTFNCVDPTGVPQQNVHNLFDFDQTVAFGEGSALSGNGGTGNGPVVSYDAGVNWTGTASPVAGPLTYYTNYYRADRQLWVPTTAILDDDGALPNLEDSGTLTPKIDADDFVSFPVASRDAVSREVDRDQYIEVQAWDTAAIVNPSVVEAWVQIEQADAGSIAFQFNTGSGWSADVCTQATTFVGYYTCDLFALGVDTLAELNALDVRAIARGQAAAADGFFVDFITLRVEYPSVFLNQVSMVGPWQRIAYENGKYGFDPSVPVAPTGDNPTIVNNSFPTCTDPTDVTTCAGHQLSSTNPLPAGTNAVRFVHGARRLGELENSRIRLRITDPVRFTDTFKNETFCLDSTGGDTSDNAAKDVPWRYYEPKHECNFLAGSAALVKQATHVNGQPSSGASLSLNDIVSYTVTLTNTSQVGQPGDPFFKPGVPLDMVDLFDRAEDFFGTPNANLTLIEPGNALCAYPSYNGDLPGPIYNAGSAAAGTATWAQIPQLAPGGQVTVSLCGRVSGGAVNDRVDNTGHAAYSVTQSGQTESFAIKSSVGGTISTLISGHVYADLDGSGDLTAGDVGFGGVSVSLVRDLNGDGMWDPDGLDNIPGNADDEVVVSVATTLSDGSYSFAGVSGNTNYLLVESDPAGWTSTGDKDTPLGSCGPLGAADACNTIGPVNVPTGGASTLNDFFDQPPASGVNVISGTVFVDRILQDGIQDPGDPGAPGTTVRLYRDQNNNGMVDLSDILLQTATTDGAGDYQFTVVEEGSFVLEIDEPLGATLTTAQFQEADFVGFGNSDPDNDFGYFGGVGSTGNACYAVADTVDQLVGYNLATPGFTDIGATGTTTMEAIAYQAGTNLLWATDSNVLGTLDRGTGLFTPRGTLGPTCTLSGGTTVTVNDVDGLSFDPLTGILYGTERDGDGTTPEDVLFQIDPATATIVPNAFPGGASCVRIPTNVAPINHVDVDDIAIDPADGQMYAIANSGGAGDRLVRVDKATGAVADVGPIGVADIEGLGFANDGQLYGTDGDNAAGQLWAIDKTSGAATMPSIFTFPSYGDYEGLDCMTAGANTITGTVFFDVNGNGLYEPATGDLGRSGVSVRLYLDNGATPDQVDAGDTLIQTRLTDSAGEFRFFLGASGNFVLDTDFPASYPGGATLTTDNVEEADFTGVNELDAGNDYGFQAPSDLTVTKQTVNAPVPPAAFRPGDRIDYRVTVTNPASATQTQTGIRVFDARPEGTAYVAQSTVGSGPVPGPQVNTGPLIASADTWFKEDNTDENNGNAAELSVLTDAPGAKTRRAVVRWNLAAIPAGAVIDSATMRFYVTLERLATTVTVHRVTAGLGPWDEGTGNNATGADWLRRDDDVGGDPAMNRLWDTPGGDFAASFDSFMPAVTDVYESVDATALVQAWVTGTANEGVLLQSNNIAEAKFGSRTNGGKEPILEVSYRVFTPTTLDNVPAGANGDLADGATPNLVLPADGFGLLPGASMTVDFSVTIDDPLDPFLPQIFNEVVVSSDQSPPQTAQVADPVDPGAAIGDLVWLDTDGDGVFDIGEEGIPNVTVRLYVDPDGVPGNGDPGEAVVATLVTDAKGKYLFKHVYPVDVMGTPVSTFYVEVDETTVPAEPTVPGSGLIRTPGNVGGRSASIDVTGITEFLDADFGYTTKIDKAAIGDLVWSDADNDGVRDEGEPGIGGVTMRLVGAGADGLFGTADDPAVVTTTTTADGLYLFTDVDPGVYRIEVDETSPALAGYAVTSGPQSPGSPISVPITVFARDIYVEADFGYFQAGLGTIGNLVFSDENGNGVFDAGVDSGIPGVSVDLIVDTNQNGVYDLGEPVIATDVTAADGTYSFSGLDLDDGGGDGDFDYIVIVSDRRSLVDGLAPTFGALGVDNNGQPQPLAVALSAGAGATNNAADFAFSAFGSVGDQLWIDADGDGFKDPVEVGIAGVTVDLLGPGPDGMIDTADDVVLETQTTDALGLYFFKGRVPGDYKVDVTDTGGVLAALGLTLTFDPDATLDGESTLTLPRRAADLTRDFGYRDLGGTLFNIEGVVFEDLDGDGLGESGEPGFTGVTLELRDAAGNVLATTVSSDGTTDVDGDGLVDPVGSYAFVDLPGSAATPVDYTVVVTDDGSVLDGYSLTSGLDTIGVTLQGADVTEVDFGYIRRPVAGSIGDTVWLDTNGDGSQTGSEPGLSRVTLDLVDVGLDRLFGTGDDAVIASTVTDANGRYDFQGLLPGNYVVDVTDANGILTGLAFTTGTTDPSITIPLSEGQDYNDADFGYVSPGGAGGKAVLGDRVWYDADGDGVQDEGEVGIAGVDIIVSGPSCDPSCTFTTGPDGLWLAKNLDPGSYGVTFDDTDITALGYDIQPTNMTSPNDTYTLTVAAGDIVTTLDFGFDDGGAGTTGSIGDEVWLDENGNGVLDAGETGIREVTLNLVGPGADMTFGTPDDEVLASTVTDENGRYDFVGVRAGSYRVDVTDVNGALVGLNPTPPATDPTATIALAAGQDYDLADFPYAPSGGTGSIGSVVWRDLVQPGDATHNGIYQPLGKDGLPGTADDEPGLEGVTVQLWLDDGDDVFEPFAAEDNLLRTVTTDANGEYEFKGLPPATYWVTVTDVFGVTTGFTRTVPGPMPGMDDNNQADPYRVPLTTAAPLNVTADFGYRANPANPVLSISGTVFEDLDNNATFSSGVEPEVSGATVRLYRDLDADGVLDPGEPLIDTKISDGSGFYQFANLPPGSYLIATDTAGTSVNNYLQTTQQEPPASFPQKGVQPVTLTTLPSTGNNFGYWSQGPTTTPVTLAYFEARGSGDVEFRWMTATEVGNLGFNLYVVTETGLERLNDELVASPVVDSLEPQLYELLVAGVEGDTFVLEDVDIRGDLRHHGPFYLDERRGSPVVEVRPVAWAEVHAERAARAAAAAAPAGLRTGGDGCLDCGGGRRSAWAAADILVERDGVHRVRFGDLLAAGVDLTGARPEWLALTNRGRPVPLRVTSGPRLGPGAWIEFVGHGLDTLYTRTNVYRLSIDRFAAARVAEDANAPGLGAAVPFYLERREVEVDRDYNVTSPSPDPWHDRRLLAISGSVEHRVGLELDDWLPGAAPVELDVAVTGGTDFPASPDHHLVVEVNGYQLGDAWFDGLTAPELTFRVPDSVLSGAGDELRLALPHDTGVLYDLVNYDKYAVTYPRRFVARGLGLDFSAAGDVFEVQGLPGSDVVVYRERADGAVELLAAAERRGAPGAYSVRFPGSREEARYWVANVGSYMIPAVARARRAPHLLNGRADVLAISHGDFVPHLGRWVDRRAAEGIRVRVVDVADVYAELGHGIVDPQAIRDYIRLAYWRLGARAVLLVGADTYDYHDVLGIGSISFVPSLYHQTDDIVRFAPVDPLYGDIDDDLLPDIPVGRWPVRTPAELAAVIDKTLAFEPPADGLAAVLAADAFDVPSGYSFAAASEEMAAALGGDWSFERVYLDKLSLDDARQRLLGGIGDGPALTSYFGHSGLTVWSFDGLFRTDDVPGLENRGRPTVITQWGCWNTYHVLPTFETLGNRLLVEPDRGAAAVLGAATLTEAVSERLLGRRVFERLAVPGKRLGDAVLEAKRDLAETEPERLDVILGWSLLGDPTLRMHP